jgi:eukaryotic-like serine/threonine-protein kinase
MERLEGETLSALLHRQRRLVPPQALAIAAGALEGLHAAHQIGVVHRDVKPPNIFLTGPTTVKVLDFGIAKIKDAKDVITARGLAVGTPRYMSPEQAHGAPVDARSDIYAIGLMLFEMVSGVGPFDDARDHNELLLAHLGRKAPLLSSISVVAPELDALVAGMLAKDPRERPPNARQVAETLRALSHRYAHYVATEAPTVNAPRTPVSEPPTRVEGQRRAHAAAPLATRPDGLAASGRHVVNDTTTVQPAFEIATTAAHALPFATQRLPDAPAHTPALLGPDTLVDPLTQAPTAVPQPAPERTEMLLHVPHSPGSRPLTDPGPTRTAVPLAEAGNLTPPPVVPAPAPPTRQSGPRPRTLALAGLAVVLVLLVSGALWLRHPAAPEPPAAPALAAEPVISDNPIAAAPPPPVAPPEVAPPAEVVPKAVLSSPEKVAPAPVTTSKRSRKRVFLTPGKSASTAPVPPRADARAKPVAQPGMPSSGL